MQGCDLACLLLNNMNMKVFIMYLAWVNVWDETEIENTVSAIKFG